MIMHQNMGLMHLGESLMENNIEKASIGKITPIKKLKQEPLNLFYSKSEFAKDIKPQKWVVKGMIQQGPTVAGIIGESGSGKSFIAQDIMFKYAAGYEDWFGRLMSGDNRKVVYLNSEGENFFAIRYRCWLQEHSMTDEDLNGNFFMLNLNAMDKYQLDKSFILSSKGFNAIMESLESCAGKEVGLIVIDTLNGFFAGNENDTTDMSQFLRCCQTMARRFKAAVVVIHHISKREKYSSDFNEGYGEGRGANSFKASIDNQTNVLRKNGKTINFVFGKGRDCASGSDTLTSIEYKIAQLDDLVDEKGNHETSLVLTKRVQIQKEISRINTTFSKLQEAIKVQELAYSIDDKGYFITKDTLKDYLIRSKLFAKNTVRNQINPSQNGLVNKMVKDGIFSIEEDRIYLIDNELCHWDFN